MGSSKLQHARLLSIIGSFKTRNGSKPHSPCLALHMVEPGTRNVRHLSLVPPQINTCTMIPSSLLRLYVRKLLLGRYSSCGLPLSPLSSFSQGCCGILTLPAEPTHCCCCCGFAMASSSAMPGSCSSTSLIVCSKACGEIHPYNQLEHTTIRACVTVDIVIKRHCVHCRLYRLPPTP